MAPRERHEGKGRQQARLSQPANLLTIARVFAVVGGAHKKKPQPREVGV